MKALRPHSTVYGGALAGWTYLVIWGALRALDVGGARKIGAVAGVLAWLVVVAEVERLGRRDDGEPEVIAEGTAADSDATES